MIDRAFVGRTAELATLASTFTGPDAPWLLLVEGPAGIGKSRLLAHFTRTAPGRVLAVTGAEAAGTQPGYLVDDIADRVADEELPDTVARRRPVPVVGYDERASAAADATARWLRSALGAAETLLVVDDAQWADPESVRALAFLIRNRPERGFRLLLACRDGGVPPALARLLHAPGVRSAQVRVPPFTAAEVEGLLPGESPGRRARLLDASHGNPLYLSLLAELPDAELDRLLAGENPDPAADGYAALDRTIRAELAQLPGTERCVAQAAAVCGTPPDLELLCVTAGLPAPLVADALDGLAGRGLIGVRDGAVVFVHPLVRTAAYRCAGHGWSTMAHRRAAQALRARGAPMPARAAQLERAMLGCDEVAGAELRLAAAQVIGDAPASSARWLAIAARIAPSAADPCADAVALGRALMLSGAADRAAATLDPAIAAPGPHQLEALLLAARCARMLGRVGRARALLASAATLPRRTGDGPVQLELAMLAMQDHQDAEGQARLTALFDSAASADPAIHAAATALRGIGFLAAGRLSEAEQAYRRGDRAFAALSDTGFRDVVHAVPAFGWCAYFLDHDRDGLAQLDRAVRISRRHGRTYALAELHTVRAYVLAKLGRLHDALAAADAATAAATTFHHPDLLAFAGAVKLRTLQLTAADQEIAAYWHTVAALPRPAMRWWHQVVDTALADVARALGLAVPAATPLDQRPGPLHPTALARAARVALAADDLATATTLAGRAIVAAGLDAPPRDISAAATASGPVDGVVTENDLPDAVGGDLPVIRRDSQIGVAVLAGAECAAAAGDLAAAADAAEVAFAAFTRAGMVVDAAQAELFAGVVAGRRGDFTAATSRFAAARAVFAAAGAHRLVAAVTTAQRRLAGSRPPGPATTLTRREREVAELAAQGQTNKDIATELHLSHRTVEDHLSRVLRKLHLTGRAGIARKLDELDSASLTA